MKRKRLMQPRQIGLTECYLDHTRERVVFLAGNEAKGYGAFCQESDGKLKRIAARSLPMRPSLAEARRNLIRYTREKGWIEIPGVRQLFDLLSLVMAGPPPRALRPSPPGRPWIAGWRPGGRRPPTFGQVTIRCGCPLCPES